MTDRELEGRLRAWYRTEVGDEAAPVALRSDVAAIPRGSSLRDWWHGGGRGVRLLAVAALLLVGSAAAAGSGLVRLPSLVPLQPVPTLAVVSTASPAPSASASTGTSGPGWIRAGTMQDARYSHTATLLANGTVLVAGGGGDGGILATAELYDPAAATWIRTGSLVTSRAGHTATLLRSGKILVAGGMTGSDPTQPTFLASAELYDPATGSWTATSSMHASRFGAAATLLQDGRVLVTGGQDGGSRPLASAELYDPATGSWTLTGSMGAPRYVHAATLLHDGRVLVTGGTDASAPDPSSLAGYALASAELYDPANGTWSAAAPSPVGSWAGYATLLPDGRVLVAGGALYDPVGGSWSPTGSPATAWGGAATLLPDGRVLVVGRAPMGSTFVYDPADGSLTPDGTVAPARWGFTMTLMPDGSVLLAGGNPSLTWYGVTYAVTDRYLPPTRASVPKPAASGQSSAAPVLAATWTPTGSMATPRSGHTATLLNDGTVLVTGGYAGNTALSSAERYDPRTGTWTSAGRMILRAGNHYTATLLLDGRVLVAGGRDSKGYIAPAELYDPATGSWTITGGLVTPRADFTAALLHDGRVLVAGGSGPSGPLGYLASAELYDPATGSWAETGSMTVPRNCPFTATVLNDGRVLVGGGAADAACAFGPLASAEIYDPATGSWTATGNMESKTGDTWAALLRDGRVLVPGNPSQLYDPTSGSWTSTGGMPGSSTGTVLRDGRVLATGSWYGSLAQAGLYDPLVGLWTATTSPGTPREQDTATLLPDGRVLVAGGSSTSGTTIVSLASAELYQPGTGR